MVKPICVPCQRFFRPSKNGFAFIEGMPTENGAAVGLAEPHKWTPYKLWMGDQWKCPDCGATIVVSVGQQPINEHYKENFQSDVIAYGGDQLQVNDC